MRRSYRAERYLGIIERVRAAMPDAAITTDIIVGFPGETEADFEQTLDVVRAGAVRQRVHVPVLQAPRHARRRPWTGQIPKAVVQERYDRLIDLLEQITWDENKKLVGRTVEVLVAEGEGRKDGATGRHVRPRPRRPAGALRRRSARRSRACAPATSCTPTVTYAAPHHLVADGAAAVHRRTRAGDAWEAGRVTRTPGVSLGMPTIGTPPPAPAPARSC